MTANDTRQMPQLAQGFRLLADFLDGNSDLLAARTDPHQHEEVIFLASSADVVTDLAEQTESTVATATDRSGGTHTSTQIHFGAGSEAAAEYATDPYGVAVTLRVVHIAPFDLDEEPKR